MSRLDNDCAIPHEAFIRIENPTADIIDDPILFKAWCRQCRQESIDRSMVQVRALLSAGWKYELADGYHDLDPFQWYWRAPPKRKNSRGRKYLSTNQAYHAMQRVKAEAP